MTSRFQLIGLEQDQFDHLFSLSDDELTQQGAVRCRATESPGYPCRISLEDAAIGEELLLLPYLHQPAASPYRSSGPIYVRRGAKKGNIRAGEVPSYVSSRLISVRAYDSAHMIVAASVCEGLEAAREIEKFFSDEQVDYIHLHNAKRGCFSCAVVRA